MPEYKKIKLAVFPPFAALILPHRIGQSAADDLILTGRTIIAQQAQEIGLVYSVSADPSADAESFIAENILPKSASAMQFAVRASRYEVHRVFSKNIDTVEKVYVRELMETEDANKGTAAFMEKRKPVWGG